MDHLTELSRLLELVVIGFSAGGAVGAVLWLLLRRKVEEVAEMVATAKVAALGDRMDRELHVLREGRLACRADLERQISRTEHDLSEDVIYIRDKLDGVAQALSDLAGVKAQLTALERAVNALASRVSL